MANEVLKAGLPFPPAGTKAQFGRRVRAYMLTGDKNWKYVNKASESSVKADEGAGKHFCVWEFQADATWKQVGDCDCTNPIPPADSTTPMPVGMQIILEC